MDLPKIEAKRSQSTPNNQPPHLFRLPNELLHMISDACLFNTAISLRQTCQTLLSIFSDPDRPVHPRCYGLDFCFERICMDDEYKCRRWGRAVCSVCKICHSLTDFSPQQIERKPTKRVCEGAQRLLSIAPDTRLSYQELLRKASGSYDDQSLNNFYGSLNSPHLYVGDCRLVPYKIPGPGERFGDLTLGTMGLYAPGAATWNTGISRLWTVKMNCYIDLRVPTAAQPILTLYPYMPFFHRRIMQMIDQIRTKTVQESSTDQKKEQQPLGRRHTVAYVDRNSGTNIAIRRSAPKHMANVLVLRPLGPLSGSASHPNWIAQSQPLSGAQQDSSAMTDSNGHFMTCENW